jgi:serine/threonine protein kinase
MKALAIDDPRVIGEYRLRAQLGAGGMGRVYLGLSPGGRAVAIKVVHPDLASDTEFLRRFSQEVAAARAVSGIYTAPVVASGLNERPPWLATAFVPGPSLDQVVTEHGPMPEPALWPLLAGLIEALQAIHACRVVHRDLKPANVLLAIDGPRVIDFGISRAADGTALTAAGVVFGTPGYMSPEQAEGKPAGPESDVFALGCVIAYAATGAGPFGSGTAAAVLYRVVYGEPALDRIPPQLREVVSACLAKDPAARPPLRALATAIANGPHTAGPSAVAFWPQSVAGIIGAYQAKLEQETRSGGRPAEAEGFSWASQAQPGSAPPDFGSNQAPQWPQQPPPPGPGAPWPYAGGPGTQSAQSPQGSAGPQGSQGFPYSQGYPSSQRYPQPQGYSGAQAPQGQSASQAQPTQHAQSTQHAQPAQQAQPTAPPPPRGYLPASGGPASSGPASSGGAPQSLPSAGPAGYPQQYQPGSRGPVYPLPASMATAVRLMYAGAAFTLIYAIGVVVAAGSIVKADNYATTGRTSVGGVDALTVVVSLIEIALWLWIARGCKNARNSARITGTVLFGIHTLVTLGVLVNHHPGIGLPKILTAISWLIACGAVVFLWRRESSAFFRAPVR